MQFLCMKSIREINLWADAIRRNEMNKLMGFYELQSMSLPAVQWKEYTGKEELSQELLWTIRSAVFHGDDLNLPRCVGANAVKAKKFADQLLKDLSNKGIVVFYPYFCANKSGTLEIYSDKIVIEAVKKDLWNLVTYSDREITITIKDDFIEYNGNRAFLTQEEVKCLCSYTPEIRRIFRDNFIQGKSILLEWSYAYNCDINKNAIGNEYLVFYEARTI